MPRVNVKTEIVFLYSAYRGCGMYTYGLVKAYDIDEAEKKVRKVYGGSARTVTVENIDWNDDGEFEIISVE